MNVREVMTTDVTAARLDSTLEQVAKMMRDEDAGAIPVLDQRGQLRGIVTDRDIVVRCLAQGKNPGRTRVEEVLSGELQTVEPEADVRQALRIMSSHQIRRLPVVQEDALVGMVSLGDIAVKHEDQDSTGEALSEVSEGVKQGSRSEVGSRAKQRGSRPQNQATGRMQAISNRSPREEQSRQARVSPARSQKRPAVRSRNRSARRRKAS